MRVNHAGEVAAQALYQGQALTSRSPELRQKLSAAADEELDHLAWTRERVHALGGRTSVFDPLWYAGAFTIGAIAGVAGDPWEKALEEVQPILRKEGLKPAVCADSQAGLQSAHGGRERFFWQFTLARLCFLAKKYELAKNQLETSIRHYRTQACTPGSPILHCKCCTCCTVAASCCRRTTPYVKAKEEIYRRLCHLDLEVVLE